MLVLQLSKHQNRTRTTFSTVHVVERREFSSGIHRKSALSRLGTEHKTVLGHLLICHTHGWCVHYFPAREGHISALQYNWALIATLFTCIAARWESAKVSHKRVFALLTPEIHSYEMAQMLQKPVFALPGCQRTSVNTLLCDTLALADQGLM